MKQEKWFGSRLCSTTADDHTCLLNTKRPMRFIERLRNKCQRISGLDTRQAVSEHQGGVSAYKTSCTKFYAEAVP